MDVDTVLGDTAYSGKDNLQFAQDEGQFQLISRLHPVITNGQREENKAFIFNKDADTFAFPADHLATKKRINSRKEGDHRNTQLRFKIDMATCQKCPLQEGCYKRTKTKSYSVTIKSTTHTEQETFQETELFRTLAKDRYMIEAKNGELKNSRGYGKAKNSGLYGMQLQSATTIFVVNLKRIVKLMDEKRTKE